MKVEQVIGIGYPSAACSTAGGPINPYTLTVSQPVQMVSTIIDQRLEMEAQLANSANTFRKRHSCFTRSLWSKEIIISSITIPKLIARKS
jgi:hypothetical protein